MLSVLSPHLRNISQKIISQVYEIIFPNLKIVFSIYELLFFLGGGLFHKLKEVILNFGEIISLTGESADDDTMY